jgi:xylulose-5-phosphate/fructose-6-phosphate phosphoketolase
MPATLSDDDIAAIDAYWRAANYLTVGQIYLCDNALLREPLTPAHIKPRLLGHWGTSPGLSLLYAHLNRVIRERDANVIFITGPGHGGPAILANVYLEGTYSEIYPLVSPDAAGMHRLFRQFSTPGGVPSHVSVPTPGSIHEGGELGYSLAHAFGAAFDNPDLVVACVIGDGEAETGPLSGSWQGIDFLNPVRDGAVLPILHLNGYKISGPTVFGRATDDAIEAVLRGYGYDVHFVEGDEPPAVHRDLASTLDRCFDAIRVIQDGARAHGFGARPQWPAIVLRTPKGWTGPKVVDGLPVEGTFRAHQVPLANVRDNADHLHQLEEWMRSYRPEELFDGDGRLTPALAKLAPSGDRRMGANAHANGGRVLEPLDLPDFTGYAIPVSQPGAELHESTRRLGEFLRDVFTRNRESASFRLVCPDETNSNRLGAVFDVENRMLVEPIIAIDDHVAHDGRVMEVLSEHNCQGWLEGYLLTGRHGLFASYEAFAMVSASMTVQHAKWLEAARDLAWREPVSSLNILLTSTAWRNDHNGFSHQGPGLIDVVLSKKGTVSRIYLPPDANCLLSVADHCLRSRDYVNLIVIDKQPQLQWLDMDTARQHAAQGASVWDWAGTEHRGEPDVVLASAGDIVTMETLAAAALLRQYVPALEVRVVNVLDLMALFPENRHPHGMDEGRFVNLFTDDTDVVFAFHGYPSAVHHLIHGRPDPGRFHVRGYEEEGTTTTPFDMVVRNHISRYHLCMEALHRARRAPVGGETLVEHCEDMLRRHQAYVVVHLEDMPEVRDWRWSP